MMLLSQLKAAIIRGLCTLDGHGPFAIPVLSTHDAAPAPAIYCDTCSADCSQLFAITKRAHVIEITNRTKETRIIRNPHGDPPHGWRVPPGVTLCYDTGTVVNMLWPL